VKSCAGVTLQESELTDAGLDLDRAWMVVDASGEFVSQRELPRMALVQVSLRGGEVVLRALHHRAGAVVLAHNHPSGSVSPSRADKALTQHLQAALRLVDVRVLDHFIVAPGAWVSMAQEGGL
jgi:DNA repair protein RadC